VWNSNASKTLDGLEIVQKHIAVIWGEIAAWDIAAVPELLNN
jgi:hypothetical protein